jgi:hypothetical protein
VTSKFFTSPAICALKAAGIELGDAAYAATAGGQVVPGFGTVLPTGETTPRPVTTTRRRDTMNSEIRWGAVGKYYFLMLALT